MTKTENPKRESVSKSATARASKQVSTTTKVTKKARLIALLSQKGGADVPSLSNTLGWLPHTTRAALTGLRKSGYEITSVKPDNGKPSRYQIAGLPGTETT